MAFMFIFGRGLKQDPLHSWFYALLNDLTIDNNHDLGRKLFDEGMKKLSIYLKIH
jgi:hypothetical protein